MSDSTRSGIQPLHLNSGDKREVVVTPADQDRFVLSAKAAANACKSAVDRELEEKEWQEYFKNFLNSIVQWADNWEFKSELSRILVAPCDAGLNLTIVTPKSGHQYQIEDSLTNLELDLFAKYPKCILRIVQLPELPTESLDAFFKVETSIQLYGDSPETPPASAA